MRGTQIDAHFQIDQEMREWAEQKVPVVNIEAETEKFVDHHLATGKVMLSWTAAWRTWMRNAVTFRGAIHYTADEMQIKRLMAEYTEKGFRRAFVHENAVLYRTAFEAWQLKQRSEPKRDMGIVTQLAQAKRA